jgi:hypothetical protein
MLGDVGLGWLKTGEMIGRRENWEEIVNGGLFSGGWGIERVTCQIQSSCSELAKSSEITEIEFAHARHSCSPRDHFYKASAEMLLWI